MKKVILFITSFIIAFLFSCNNDDVPYLNEEAQNGEENIDKFPSQSEDSEFKHVHTDCCFIDLTEIDTLGVKFQFYLLNEKKEETTVFKEGESFLLGLTVINQRDTFLSLPAGLFTAGLELGYIYDATGNFMGSLFRDGYTTVIPAVDYGISSGAPHTYTIPWKLDESHLLPSGNYHIIFDQFFNLKEYGTFNEERIRIRMNLNFTVE